jgi:phosphopantothenoylcysteine decarboxylase/phosphopantothenate--cysteine ligase
MGFALEARNPRENALQKLRRKNCDWILLNAPSAIGADDNSVELLAPDGSTLAQWSGSKGDVARAIVEWIGERK